MTTGPPDEDDLIEAARQGDSDAYGQLVGAYRGELHAHCYRMLGSSAGGEIAGMLRTTPASVYSSLQRAHKAVRGRLPQPSQQATLRRLGDAALRQIVDRYVDAWHRGDVDSIVTMLTQDAVLSMPPLPEWFKGDASIRAFLAMWPLTQPGRSRLVATRANGQLAFGHYRLDEATGRYLAHSLDVIALRGTRIAGVTAFFLPDSFAPYGLGASLEPLPR
jgi:ketosteroid isomerase-like protein